MDNELELLLSNANEKQESGQHEDAIADFTQVIELYNPDTHPNDLAYAFRFRGNSYGNLNKYEDAIADYTRAIELFNLKTHPNDLAKVFCLRRKWTKREV